jgi:hypothetical protein
MKTLLESTDTSATYEFSHDTATRTVTYHKPETAETAPDFDVMADAEHAAWLTWLGASE